MTTEQRRAAAAARPVTRADFLYALELLHQTCGNVVAVRSLLAELWGTDVLPALEPVPRARKPRAVRKS